MTKLTSRRPKKSFSSLSVWKSTSTKFPLCFRMKEVREATMPGTSGQTMRKIALACGVDMALLVEAKAANDK